MHMISSVFYRQHPPRKAFAGVFVISDLGLAMGADALP